MERPCGRFRLRRALLRLRRPLFPTGHLPDLPVLACNINRHRNNNQNPLDNLLHIDRNPFQIQDIRDEPHDKRADQRARRRTRAAGKARAANNRRRKRRRSRPRGKIGIDRDHAAERNLRTKRQVNVPANDEDGLRKSQDARDRNLPPNAHNIFRGQEHRAHYRACRLIIQIRDNGCGIPPALLRRLNSELSALPPTEDGQVLKRIGIRNVSQRIGLVFGKGYGIQLSSIESVGTDVTLTIPRFTRADLHDGLPLRREGMDCHAP